MVAVDITELAAGLTAALKSAGSLGLAGVSVPCSPAEMNKALKGGTGVEIPGAVSAWLTDASKGLEALVSTVNRNPDATLSDSAADELVRGWLGIGGLLTHTAELLGCLSNLVDGALKVDPVPAAPLTGMQPLLEALRSVPAPEWASLVPLLLSPADGSILSDFPRVLVLRWQRIPLAASYQLEVEYCEDEGCTTTHPLASESVVTTEASVEFVGKQPGRWRVAAVDAHGVQGSWSPWSHFTYTV